LHVRPSAAFLIALVMSSMVADFSRRHVKSTTDTSGVGTRKAIPVSLPFIVGITLPTALAAPVEDGMMFSDAQRPPRQSWPQSQSQFYFTDFTNEPRRKGQLY